MLQTVGQVALNESYSGAPITPIASTRYEHGARYSPDGKRIAFVSNRTGDDELWVADTGGTNPIQLTRLKAPLVDLSWNAAPAVVGYNVYRASRAGGPYSKINSVLDAGTVFSDSSVQGGQSYYYVTTSVDSTGAQSSYSNEIQAAIPTP